MQSTRGCELTAAPRRPDRYSQHASRIFMNAPAEKLTAPVEAIRGYHAELRTIRRDIHAHPELAFQESRTSDLVAARLAAWGIEVHRGLAKTGLVGVIKGKKTASGRAIGLRADMDCLPMHETSDIPHRSTHAGRMHACGHDGHTTMLLGAARYLQETRNFDGTAYVIFQPAEEGGGGGRVMVEEGLFERFPANEIYAVHNWPGLPPGQMAVRPGPVMAATDEIVIKVNGRGGHAAMPHLTVDPVVVTAQIISAMQTIASRNVSPLDSIVVTVASMETSQTNVFNVIPDFVKLIGTVRTFRPETRDLAEKRIKQIVAGIAQAMGGGTDVEYKRGYPSTINSEQEAQFAAKVGELVFGKQNVFTDAEPTMGGEDFSYMLQARPGAYIFLGQGGGPGNCFLHNPGYDFNDEVIPLGAGYLSALVEQSLPLK
jgi:hippurate hydrolase